MLTKHVVGRPEPDMIDHRRFQHFVHVRTMLSIAIRCQAMENIPKLFSYSASTPYLHQVQTEEEEEDDDDDEDHRKYTHKSCNQLL